MLGIGKVTAIMIILVILLDIGIGEIIVLVIVVVLVLGYKNIANDSDKCIYSNSDSFIDGEINSENYCYGFSDDHSDSDIYSVSDICQAKQQKLVKTLA